MKRPFGFMVPHSDDPDYFPSREELIPIDDKGRVIKSMHASHMAARDFQMRKGKAAKRAKAKAARKASVHTRRNR